VESSSFFTAPCPLFIIFSSLSWFITSNITTLKLIFKNCFVHCSLFIWKFMGWCLLRMGLMVVVGDGGWKKNIYVLYRKNTLILHITYKLEFELFLLSSSTVLTENGPRSNPKNPICDKYWFAFLDLCWVWFKSGFETKANPENLEFGFLDLIFYFLDLNLTMMMMMMWWI
jgi:hypothetical protein